MKKYRTSLKNVFLILLYFVFLFALRAYNMRNGDTEQPIFADRESNVENVFYIK